MSKKIKHRLISRRFMIIFDFIGVIMLWRGVWGLMDVFLFPGNYILSYSASILLGAVFIFIDGDGIRDITH